MRFASQQMRCVQNISANFDGTINNMHPLAFLVNSSTNDVFTFKDYMRQDDAIEILEAISDRIFNSLENKYNLIN